MWEIVAEYGTTVVAAVLGMWVIPAIVGLIKQQVQSKKIGDILIRLSYALETAINEVAQVYTDELKHASEDGVLTDAEKARALELALDSVKSYLGPRGIKELLEILGIEIDALDQWLSRRIEGQIGMGKQLTRYSPVERQAP